MAQSFEARSRQVRVHDTSVHVVDAGPDDAAPVVFLHGWPQSWRAWDQVMQLAAPEVHALAIDLPGVGPSTPASPTGSTAELAATIHDLFGVLDLTDVTLVGHDIGGMIAYTYLRHYHDVARVAILDTVIPGVDPWDDVLRNPYLWHFAFHAIASLPELLIHGHQSEYFDYFFDGLAADATRITPDARADYAAAYHTPEALTAGLDFYRAFQQDAADNTELATADPTETPLLYVRGEHESGDIAAYERGFHDAGVANVTTALIPDAGHFTPEENPSTLWEIIRDFAAQTRGDTTHPLRQAEGLGKPAQG